MKICPIALRKLPKIVQNYVKNLLSPPKWPNTFIILPKWNNFAESGHSDIFRTRKRDKNVFKSELMAERDKDNFERLKILLLAHIGTQ